MRKLIHHTGRFSIVYSDYVGITGDPCAAQVLSTFETWTYERLKDGDNNPWLYVQISDIVNSICGTFKRSKVIESLKILRLKGFIESKSSLDSRDKTLSYKLNIENIQQALNKSNSKAQQEEVCNG